MRRSVVVTVVSMLTLAGCGGGGGSTSAPSSAAPTAVAPTPTPTPTPVPVPPNVAGVWKSEARQWYFELRQSGSRLTGVLLGFKNVTYSNPDHPDLQISGAITTSGHVNFACAAFSLGFEGDVGTTLQRMDGTLYDCANGCRNYGEILVRQ